MKQKSIICLRTPWYRQEKPSRRSRHTCVTFSSSICVKCSWSSRIWLRNAPKVVKIFSDIVYIYHNSPTFLCTILIGEILTTYPMWIIACMAEKCHLSHTQLKAIQEPCTMKFEWRWLWTSTIQYVMRSLISPKLGRIG